MKSTMCFFVRDLLTRRIVHHEIEEVDSRDAPPNEHARLETARIRHLMRQYPVATLDVFLQGFNSLTSLYSC